MQAHPLAGKVAVVTGASRGYGESVARALADKGARVGVLGRDADRVAAVSDDIGGVGAVADALNPAEVKAAMARIDATLGAVDLLVNNAGIGGPLGLGWEVDPDEWWNCIEVNVRGPYIASRALLPSMIAAGRGTIINIVSHAGTARWPFGSAYSVAKAALIKFGENLAAEVRRHGIVVVNYHPGILEIGLTANLFAQEPAEGSPAARVAAWFRDQIATGRSVSTEQSVDVLLELAATAGPELSGRYVTAYDDLVDVKQKAGAGADDMFTLGLIR
jgi:NAD(P)-dependent dehydrogenase (short-subunit alcohol dehydrogenase family)